MINYWVICPNTTTFVSLLLLWPHEKKALRMHFPPKTPVLTLHLNLSELSFIYLISLIHKGSGGNKKLPPHSFSRHVPCYYLHSFQKNASHGSYDEMLLTA
jgi:hypothetical protein